MRASKSRRPDRDRRRSDHVVPWKSIVAIVVVVAAAFAAPSVWGHFHHPEVVPYSRFVQALDGGRIASLAIQPGERITGRWRGSRPGVPGAEFEVVYPQMDASSMLARAEKVSVPVSFDAPPDVERTKLIASIVVPLVAFGIGF